MEHTFEWKYGGGDVKIYGSFNNWKEGYKMKKHGFMWKITLILDSKLYQYKFFVDNEWRYDSDTFIVNNNGNINNVVNIIKDKIKIVHFSGVREK